MSALHNRSRFGRFGSILNTFGAAMHISRAIEAGQMPASEALKSLGINESAFRNIRLK
jgi:hypothetical protein